MTRFGLLMAVIDLAVFVSLGVTTLRRGHTVLHPRILLPDPLNRRAFVPRPNDTRTPPPAEAPTTP